MTEYSFVERVPTTEEYLIIRRAVGLEDMDREAVEIGLSKSLFAVCIIYENKVVGFGRVIGDEGIYYYIQDVLIHPEHQKQGNGRGVMDTVMGYFVSKRCSGATIGLMAAQGVAGFYKKYGFEKKFPDRPGMFKYVNDIDGKK